ncbi:PspC domain-containing protein [Nonomuraea sp. MCN248]|uniref:PspC domain-containing protein n=1 Tax=Nonomuraea corallina TaxID=2989783 RepID=A0ABT4S524_9ACTN|nr:PspC domain-containing protein [Nonomuraea corallina]MDA0632284.1 PspC domain-containing protein [Nonomuraea corallina]
MSEYHSSKQLRRTHKGRMLGGVCSGVGEFVGIDPNIIRIGLAIVTLFGGLGIGIYAIGWLLLPEEGKDTSIVQDLLAKQQEKNTGSNPWTEDDHKPRQ